MSYESPKLFKESKNGSIRQWRTWSEEDRVYTEYGVLGGKLQKSYTVAEAKNIGKSNETTPEEQAAKESEAKYDKKLKKAYFESIEEAKELQIAPMKAKDYNADKMEFPCDIQRKLNGVRAMAMYEDGKLVLKSRGNEYWHDVCSHISRDLKEVLKKGDVLDGEIYLHGASLQRINQLAKKYREGETEKLSLYVYDSFVPENADQVWGERREKVNNYKNAVETSQFINPESVEFVESYECNNSEDVNRYYEQFLEEGYEGGIIRLRDYPYELGHRSSGMFKMKNFDDAEFKIVGYTNGKGKFRDCAVWLLDNAAGQTFEVTAAGPIETKERLLREADSHIGEMVKVKYMGYTDDGIPNIPVSLGIRLEKDMD